MPTVLHRLWSWAESSPDQVAQGVKRDGGWTTLSVKEFADRVLGLAIYLESRGFTKSDIGAIYSFNRPEWVQADLAIMLLGAKSVGVYPNASPNELSFVLEDVQAKVWVVQNENYYRKIEKALGEKFATLSPEVILVIEGEATFSAKAVPFSDAVQEGQDRIGRKNVRHYLAEVLPSTPAFLVYTSGTTGNPKGAILSHDNLVFAADIGMKTLQLEPEDGQLFSFLPLCHVAERLQNVGVGISGRYPVYYATSFDQLSQELPEVEPSLLLCVPRVWEKMMEGVENKLKKESGLKQKLVQQAFKTGQEVLELQERGITIPFELEMQWKLMDRLVFRKIKKALGLGKIKRAASGAAAFAPSVDRWFRAIGIEILATYGQTESTGLITFNQPGVLGVGTVGSPMPDTEVKIASDGEIMVRGRQVFQGYYKNNAATKDTLEDDGWLHTGDLGEFNEKGQLQIRGRKKEIMKSSGGKMVAPAVIENKLKESPLISQACLVGDGKKYFSALITVPEDVRARTKQVESGMIMDPEILAAIKKYVDQVNAGLSSYEQVKKFKVLGKEFSVDAGEMTPTLKMKRNVIEKNYAPVIESLYQ